MTDQKLFEAPEQAAMLRELMQSLPELAGTIRSLEDLFALWICPQCGKTVAHEKVCSRCGHHQ